MINVIVAGGNVGSFSEKGMKDLVLQK